MKNSCIESARSPRCSDRKSSWRLFDILTALQLHMQFTSMFSQVTVSRPKLQSVSLAPQPLSVPRLEPLHLTWTTERVSKLPSLPLAFSFPALVPFSSKAGLSGTSYMILCIIYGPQLSHSRINPNYLKMTSSDREVPGLLILVFPVLTMVQTYFFFSVPWNCQPASWSRAFTFTTLPPRNALPPKPVVLKIPQVLR